MILYYAPFACSMAAHIVCLELAVPFELRRVSLESKQIEGGGELSQVNAMEQVPTLVLEDGRTLTENAAVLLFLGDRDPQKQLSHPPDSGSHYELVRWLSFVGTELHKNVNAQVFSLTAPEAVRAHARVVAPKALSFVEKHLANRDTLVGDTFTVAHAYLVWALTIMPFGGIPLDGYPTISAYQKRHAKRDSVQAALALQQRFFNKPIEASLA